MGTGRMVAARNVRKGVVVAVVVAAVATLAVGTGASKGRAIYTKGVLSTADVGKLRELVWRARFESLSGTTAIDAPTAARYGTAFTTTLSRIDSTVALYRQRDLTADQFTAINKFTTSWAAYLSAREAGQRLKAAGDNAGWERNRQERLTQATEEAFDSLDSSSRKAAISRLTATDTALRNARIIIIVIIAAGAAMVVMMLTLLGGGMSRRDAPAAPQRGSERAIKRGRGSVIDWNQLDLRFQPVVDLATNLPVGVETTLSRRHPAMPVSVATAEAAAGPEINIWRLDQSCQQLSTWLRAGHDLWVSLDVSSEQLVGPEFVDAVVVALDQHQVPGASLIIEVVDAGRRAGNEAAADRDLRDAGNGDSRTHAIAQNLSRLRSMGVGVAVDHADVESTSSIPVQLVPADLLKVDRKLFSPSVDAGSPATAIIDEMVRVGHRTGVEVEVAACGLTQEVQVEEVRAAGCRYGQGELFGRPVSAANMTTYLERHRAQRR